MSITIATSFFFILGILTFYTLWFGIYMVWSSRGLIPKKDGQDTVHTTRMEFDAEGNHIRTQKKGYRKYHPWRNK